MSTTAVQTDTAEAARPEDLPVGRVRHSRGPFDDSEFTTFPDVPVFAEHVTKRKDGEKLEFGRPELEAIARRCNRRIQETGDYAVLTLGHTPDPDDANGKDPEVVGYAGPYKVGLVGQPGGPHRYAILADFHVFKEKAGEVKRHPRRSPELWLADSPEDMFLDPIALLGAAPPRLDMGMLYSAKYNGRERIKYAAVAPAAGSVFVPKHEGKDYAKQIAQGDNAVDGAILDPASIQQILDALEQLDWVQHAKSQMMAETGANATEGMAPELPMEEEAPAVPTGLNEDELPPNEMPGEEVPPMAEEEGPPVAEAEEEASVPEEEVPAAAGLAKPIEKEEKMPSEDIDPAKAKKIMGEGEIGGKPLSGKQEGMFGAAIGKLKEAMDAMSDDEIEDYVKRRKIGRYAVEGTAVGESPEVPANTGTVDTTAKSLSEGTADETNEKEEDVMADKKYGQQGHVVKGLEGRVEKLQQDLDVERGKRVDAERYALLSERRVHFAFDLDDQQEKCCYAKMSADQFADKLSDIEANYRRIPVGEQLPTHGSGVDRAASAVTRSADVETAKYAKQDTDKAVDICMAAAARDEKVDYKEVLDKVRADRNGT